MASLFQIYLEGVHYKAINDRLHSLPFTYNKGVRKLEPVGRLGRCKWLLCIGISILYGNTQSLIFGLRAFVDNYPVGLLLQELAVPLTFGLYNLQTLQVVIYQNELRVMLNYLMDINRTMRRILWVADSERDGVELFICSFMYNMMSIVVLRVPILIFLDSFNNMYAYYELKRGPHHSSLWLRSFMMSWDLFVCLQYLTVSTTFTVTIFIFINSSKLWCKRMMLNLRYIEFQPKALREQIIIRYRALQVNHRLFSYIFLEIIFPLALASCSVMLVTFIFVTIKFSNVLGLVGLIMTVTVVITVVVVIWVLLYSFFQLTKSSKEFLRTFQRYKGHSKSGRVICMSLEPLYIRIGFAYTATESTVLTLFRIVLDVVVNLLIAVD